MFGRRQRHARGHRDSGDDRRAGAATMATRDVVDDFGGRRAPLPDRMPCCTVRAKLQTLAAAAGERDRSRSPRRASRPAETSRRSCARLRAERALGANSIVEDAPPLRGNRFT
jgi:hypothetical protein